MLFWIDTILMVPNFLITFWQILNLNLTIIKSKIIKQPQVHGIYHSFCVFLKESRSQFDEIKILEEIHNDYTTIISEVKLSEFLKIDKYIKKN